MIDINELNKYIELLGSTTNMDLNIPFTRLQYKKSITKNYLNFLKNFLVTNNKVVSTKEILEFIFLDSNVLTLNSFFELQNYNAPPYRHIAIDKHYNFEYNTALLDKIDDLNSMIPIILNAFNSVFKKNITKPNLLKFLFNNDRIIESCSLFLIFKNLSIEMTINSMMNIGIILERFKEEPLAALFTHKIYRRYKQYYATEYQYSDELKSVKYCIDFLYNYFKFNEDATLSIPKYVYDNHTAILADTINGYKVVIYGGYFNSLSLVCKPNNEFHFDIMSIGRNLTICDFIRNDEIFLQNLKGILGVIILKYQSELDELTRPLERIKFIEGYTELIGIINLALNNEDYRTAMRALH